MKTLPAPEEEFALNADDFFVAAVKSNGTTEVLGVFAHHEDAAAFGKLLHTREQTIIGVRVYTRDAHLSVWVRGLNV